jgi:hypothetical protein
MRKVIQTSIVVVAIALLFALVAASFYYDNTVLDNKKSQILPATSPEPSGTTPITPVDAPNLEATLGVSEVPAMQEGAIMKRAYNRLYIEGTVNNTGKATVLNAGLHIVAYAADGTLEINLTVPLIPCGELGTDDELTSYILSYDAVYPIGLVYYYKSLTFENLAAGQGASVAINIYHRGTVTNWTVTPVYTTST